MLNKVNETKNKVFFFFLFFLLSFPLLANQQTSNILPGHKKTSSAGWNDHPPPPPQNPGVADKGMLIDFVARRDGEKKKKPLWQNKKQVSKSH
jgi:hypothetical protein